MCNLCELPVDLTKADAFADRLLGHLNGGALALMVSLGHRGGLFDAMASLPPSTAAEVAAAAGLQERYVREWLGAMVTGEIVDHDAATARYHLSAEHARSLTRAAGGSNMAMFAQFLPLLASVEDQVLACFRAGGGVPYEAYGRFHEIMAEESGQSVLPALLDAIVPLVPGLRQRLEAGIDVLDVGCGRGRALLLLAAAFPNSRFVGHDLSPEAIGWARAAAARQGSRNLRFEERDVALALDVAAFDLVTAFDAIHDQADPARVLANIARAVRPDGVFLMQDIDGSSDVEGNRDHPLGPLLYTISTMHCMTVSLARGGAGLGTMWGRQTATRMLGEAGFASTELHRLPHDVQNAYYVNRPAAPPAA